MGLEGVFVALGEALDGDFDPPRPEVAEGAETPPAVFPVDGPLLGPLGPTGPLEPLLAAPAVELPFPPPPVTLEDFEPEVVVDFDGPLLGPKGPPGPPPEGFELVLLPPMVVPEVVPDVTANDGMPFGPGSLRPSVSLRSISISASLR